MILQGRLLIDPARPPVPGWLRIENGVIAELHEGSPPVSAMPPSAGGADRIITPAFFDAHTHPPQTDSVGCDGMELLDWLDRVIFPAETWWGRGAAISMAQAAASRHMTQGTIGVAAYLTSHGAINREVLGELASRTPLRFIAGRVGMDRLAPPELTREDLERAAMRPVPSCVLAAVDSSPRHRVSANPRFAITCSEELLAEFGWHAKENPQTYVQTHLSESVAECRKIKELFPNDRDYTSVYDRFGLLHERTLLGHCIHLSDDEWRLLAARKCVLVHCPTANVFLEAGLFNLDKSREFGARVGLGTDVAAGSDVAMPRVARAMIETAKVRKMTGAKGVHVPTPAEAWTMITRTNADLLGWSDAGRLEKGAAADLLVLRVPDSWHDEHIVGRLIYGWSERLIENRIFNGKAYNPS